MRFYQNYNSIIDAIQKRLNKCPTRSDMDQYNISSSTLNLIMNHYKASRISVEDLRIMMPKECEELFYPSKNLQRMNIVHTDFQYCYERIHTNGNRVNISYCLHKYKEQNSDGYEKSQFYEYYNRFVEENYSGKSISMAVNRKTGEKMRIAWNFQGVAAVWKQLSN